MSIRSERSDYSQSPRFAGPQAETQPLMPQPYPIPQPYPTAAAPQPPGTYPNFPPFLAQNQGQGYKNQNINWSPGGSSAVQGQRFQIQGSGGIRTEPHLPRGVWTSSGPNADDHWLLALECVLSYKFKDPDLLEEALESPGSGVTCTNNGRRRFLDGNRSMANVGDAVMRLVLKDQLYLYHVPEGESTFLGASDWADSLDIL